MSNYMKEFKAWHKDMQSRFPITFALPPTNNFKVVVSRNRREGHYFDRMFYWQKPMTRKRRKLETHPIVYKYF